MRSRREFLMAGAAAGAFSVARVWAAKTYEMAFPYEELEARIARRDFREMTKDVCPRLAWLSIEARSSRTFRKWWCRPSPRASLSGPT